MGVQVGGPVRLVITQKRVPRYDRQGPERPQRRPAPTGLHSLHTPAPEVRHRTHSPAQRTPAAAGAMTGQPKTRRGKAQRPGTALAGDKRRATTTAQKPKTWEA
ncbi:hypothetical protein Scani_57830 [Streptomyces caniferus]|uniref:Uncharacterized protein n=1 Tax=Streptomyces caniferus TaxID=285557 RepID=A0A640SJ39_9ACTN|nr:hypothetical protein Scani_57830 [Streptomyces caniferus]